MQLTFGNLISETITLALKNIASVLGAAILWLLTCWIPYINVGTTIALFYGMPIELSRGNIMNPMAIFDGKYRKYMGEFFNIVGLMLVSLIPAFMFMLVPGIIISIGWMFAVLLLIDRQMNPSEALMSSTKYTYGYKWTLFLAQLVIGIILSVIASIIMSIVNAIDVDFITALFMIALAGLYIAISVSFMGVAYRHLVVERNDQ